MEEFALLDQSYESALSLKRATPSKRAYTMLVVLLDRAERTGRLYPNLRSAMFTWHGTPTAEDDASEPDAPWSAAMMGQMVRIPMNDYQLFIEELLQVPMDESQKNKFGPRPIGECLLNFTLDLAAGCPSYRDSYEDRRRTLQLNIDLVVAGLRQTRPARRKRARTA